MIRTSDVRVRTDAVTEESLGKEFVTWEDSDAKSDTGEGTETEACMCMRDIKAILGAQA